MADVELQSLELQITGDARDAKNGLDALMATLDTLKTKVKGGCGLGAVAREVGKLATETKKLDGSEGAKLESLAKGLNALTSLGKIKFPSNVATQIASMGSAIRALDGVDFSKIKDLAVALAPLETLGKSNLGSMLNQLKKLPEIVADLGKVDMDDLKKKIRALADAFKPLADEMAKVAAGFSAFPARIKAFLSSSAKVPSANKASALSFADLGAKILVFFHSMKRVASVVASWINESNEYVENLNLFTVSMGEYAAEAQKYAESIGEVMGIDPSDWMRNQGVFMTLATGFGVATDRAATMSQQLTQLGYDISSFYNTSVEDAMQKLQSGLYGELEPLRRLGYDLSQAKLEATALSLGIDKTVSSMTQAEKAELRYYAIMTQVTQVQGDMARTLNAPANQLRIFKAQLTQTARALGNIFIPALNAILPYAIAAVKVIRVLANVVASLFNFTLPEMDYSAGSNVGTDIADGMEEANKQAVKLKRTLLGIDELNVLPDTTGNGDDIYGGGGFDFELPTYDFISEAIDNRVNQIVEDMKKWLGITEDIDTWSELFDTRLGTILKTVGLIGAGLLAWKVTTTTIAAINAIKTLLSSPTYSIAIGVTVIILGIIGFVDAIKNAIRDGLDGFNFAEILGNGLLATGGAAFLGTKIATWITTAFSGSGVANALTTAAMNLFGQTMGPVSAGAISAAGGVLMAAIGGIIAGIPMYITGIWDAIQNGIDWLSGLLIPAGSTAAIAGVGAIIGMLGGPIGAGVGALIGLAVGLVTDLVILVVQNWEVITKWCADACATVGQFFVDLWNGITTGAVAAWEWVKSTAIAAWNAIKSAAISAWDGIKSVYATIKTWINANIVQPVGSFFSNMWNGFLNGAKSAWAGVKSVFSTVGTFFKTTFENAWSGVVKVFSTAGNIFTDIKDGILKAFKSIVNGLIKGLNSVIATPFNGINKVLRDLRDINILGLTPFADLKTISVPVIPYLAEGGVVDAGQMFVANEAGPEIVGNVGRKTAVMNNDQIVESVSQGVYRAVVQAMAQSSGDQIVEAKVNDKVLFEVVVNRNRQETMRTGYSPLMGGV